MSDQQPQAPAVPAAKEQTSKEAVEPQTDRRGRPITPAQASPAKSDVKDAFNAANSKSEPKAESAPSLTPAEKRKLKIDDQEIDEDEIIQIYKQRKEHQRAASRELNEGKAAKKQAEEFVKMMKDKGKLFEAIQKLGHDPRRLAEEYLASQLEDEVMDPRDKELRDARAKLKHIEDMERQQREAAERRHLDEMKAKYSREFEAQFVDALKTTGLPPTKPMVAEMAKYIARSAKIGFKMTPQEAAQLVREDLQQVTSRLIGDSDGETLIKLLGEDVANKVRKWDTGRIKSPNQFLKTPPGQEPKERQERAKQGRYTPKEWAKVKRGLK